MGEFINGYNANIPNFTRNVKNDSEQNNSMSVNKAEDQKNPETTQQVSQEATLDFLSQMGNLSLANIKKISPMQNKSVENVSDLINEMLSTFSTEVVKGLTVPQTVENSMLSFEDLVDKATLILNTEFGGIAQYDSMSEEDKLALAAQFVLNMFSEN